METNLIVEGFKFMGLGMGTVFLFLIILILTMYAQAYIVDKYFPEPKVVDASQTTQQDNKKIIAAITAAIKHHREG